ncbi:hypothetical protein M0802_011922 [Mischocyttarus mexicanus]|nr:hypothetical protein M0802_011922 [Mischocyttarus mexicanus]
MEKILEADGEAEEKDGRRVAGTYVPSSARSARLETNNEEERDETSFEPCSASLQNVLVVLSLYYTVFRVSLLANGVDATTPTDDDDDDDTPMPHTRHWIYPLTDITWQDRH